MRSIKGLFLTAAILIASFSLAHAAGGINPQPQFTYQTGVSSITTNIVIVSTSSVTGAVQVDSPTLTSRVVLEIQNLDSSANLWCLPVSTKPVTNGGRVISPRSSWIVSTLDTYYGIVYSTITNSSSATTNTAKFWCISDGVTPSSAAVTQMY